MPAQDEVSPVSRMHMAGHQIAISQSSQLEVQLKDVKLETCLNDDLVRQLGISKWTPSRIPPHGDRRHTDWEKLNKLSENWEKW